MTNFNYQSTSFPVVNQQEETSTTKSASITESLAEKTDANFTISIFQLPLETFKKVMMGEKKEERNNL
jgi:hypothetical protein